MTIFYTDEKGQARDRFSGKAIDPLGIEPKVVKKTFRATPQELSASTKIHAENAFQIAGMSEHGAFPVLPKTGSGKKRKKQPIFF